MIEYRDVVSAADLEAAWAVRFEVFVDEQNVPLEEEVDGLDSQASTLHCLAFLDGECVGTGRVLLEAPGRVHIGRLAVRRNARGCGIGAGLMAHLEGRAFSRYARNGRVVIVLSSQEHAMKFYHALGYEPVSGERYLDAGIWHQDMVKTLDTPR